jgi:TPR repeat protein
MAEDRAADVAYAVAAEAGDSGAIYNLGVLLEDSDRNQARRWYEKAADAEHATAMYNLGVLLEDTDPDQARRWFEKAAEAGAALPERD